MGRVLIVEDDPVARELLAEVLQREGHAVVAVPSAENAVAQAEAGDFQVVVTDIRLAAPMGGLELLRVLKAAHPAIQVIVVTAFGSLHTAVEAIRGGAFDYVSKPFRMEEMRSAVRRALDAYASEAQPVSEEADEETAILGRAPAMTEVFKSIARVASLKVSVLIQGETGTGKELVARAIHESGDRAHRPYITVNCASLPEGLFESELFGHVKGAFTGAATERKGLFEAAEGGTILLDEIGDMPAPVQAKLLRVLETGEIRPVGATGTRHVDVRVLAATHRDLERSVEFGTFRQDLFYRLNAVRIVIPPLRERLSDLPLLADYFLKRHARSVGRRILGLTPAARRVLEAYSWPGNVRELSHVLERAAVLAKGPLIEVEDLAIHVQDAAGAAVPAAPAQTLDDVEKAHILAVLRSVGGNRVRAAAVLGIDRKTLYRKLLRYGLPREDEGA